MNLMEIPVQVDWILKRLEDAGYEAYLVGGCVRDVILGRRPGDWDITTSAKPEEVRGLFPHTADTGVSHGTVTVIVPPMPREIDAAVKRSCEVTTFRMPGGDRESFSYRDDGREGGLYEDLGCRDFTINAMAYSHKTGLIDPCGGVQDLRAKQIKCVNRAEDRFSEDPLRMLRAVRFAAELGFTLSDDVTETIRKMADMIDGVSVERIRDEIMKILVSPHPAFFRLVYTTGLTSVIMPEFDRIMVQTQNNPHHLYSVGEHSLAAMENIRADKILRLALLLHDIGKPDVRTVDARGLEHFHGHAARSAEIAEGILKRLRFDRDTMKKVLLLVEKHSMFPQLSAREVRRAAYETGPELFDSFLEVKRADIMAHHPDLVRRNLDYLEQIERIWKDICIHHDCLSMEDLKISGSDLLADGMKPGKEVGEVLQQLLFEVLAHPEVNGREYLLAESRKIREEIM